ncbi:hypothetical protein [Gordonia terrae]
MNHSRAGPPRPADFDSTDGLRSRSRSRVEVCRSRNGPSQAGDCRTHGIACARLTPDEGTSMPSRIAALGNHDAATLTGYLEVCDDQWEHWQSMVNTARLAGADPRSIRLYDSEAAYWSRFAEMLRVAIAEVEASNRRAGRRRTA